MRLPGTNSTTPPPGTTPGTKPPDTQFVLSAKDCAPGHNRIAVYHSSGISISAVRQVIAVQNRNASMLRLTRVTQNLSPCNTCIVCRDSSYRGT